MVLEIVVLSNFEASPILSMISSNCSKKIIYGLFRSLDFAIMFSNNSDSVSVGSLESQLRILFGVI